MRIITSLAAILLIPTLQAAVERTADPFYGDPPDDHHPWTVHDGLRPQPTIVTPGTSSTAEQPGKPPSDAIILFDGSEASLTANWEADKPDLHPGKWKVVDGAMECQKRSGFIRTKKTFGDIQLHVEWAAPKAVKGDGQNRGNSGIFLMGLAEIQVLDNYDNKSYADGMAGAYYGVSPPMANVLRPPGEFQIVDIVFRRPIYKDGAPDDQPTDPGHVTVFINGVLVQDATMLEGAGGHLSRSRMKRFPDKGPLKFQDHGNPVRFRNVWLRPLPPRPSEGSSDGGWLDSEATMAKRKETAALLRAEAKNQAGKPLEEMKTLLESIVYDPDATATQQAMTLARQYVDDIKALPADQLNVRKAEITRINAIFKYMVRHRILADFAPEAELKKLVEDQGWK